MILIDSQRLRVYEWENVYVAPHDKTVVPFNHIQNIVDWVWDQEGLLYPPRVEPLPKQNTRNLGDATRTKVRFQTKASIYTWVILHELAHSMTSTVEEDNNGHGSLYMGVYIQLLSRYLKLSYGQLADSAKANGLHIRLDARPVFI